MALHRLNVKKVAAAEPGRHADGGGLYLLVAKGGARSWVLRTVVHGRQRDIGLGPTWRVPLATARQEAARLRAVARSGGDPLIERRAASQTPSFEAAAEQVWEARREGWRNPKHAAQWIATLREYAYPRIGPIGVDVVTSAHILEILGPIWLAKPETARRVRQRLRVVFDWARAAGFRADANPLDGVGDALPRQVDEPTHHAALPWRRLPTFMADLVGREAVAAAALRFAILTAARSGEVRGARWCEIDRAERVWAVPGERMKTKRSHRVPLSDAAIAALDAARGLDAELIFPSPRGRTLSDMAFKKLFDRMGYADVTAHGFRSTFRDWCSEAAHAPREVAEAALAHSVGDAVERAYARSDLFDRRRALMDAWGAFAVSEVGARRG